MDISKYGKCFKCGAEILFNEERFTPTLCACGRLQVQPFEADGIEFREIVATSPLFNLYSGLYKSKGFYVNVIVLRKDAPEYEWCLKTANAQAQLLLNLKHLNISPVFDFGIKDGYFCLTTPLLDGYPLSAYKPEKDGLLPIENLIDILQASALGLAVAHDKKLNHHNIWPDNIHIDGRGMIRVKNFFLSRFIYEYDQKRTMRENHIYSSVSPYYISPEKVESGIEDERGDVFSFGVMFYYFLTGKFPFHGSKPEETIYSRVKLKYKARRGQVTASYDISPDDFPDFIPPVPPKQLREDIPSGISKLITKMLSYYPNDRPSFAEIIASFNLLRAKADALKIRKQQVEIIDTETKAIPKMKPQFKGKLR